MTLFNLPMFKQLLSGRAGICPGLTSTRTHDLLVEVFTNSLLVEKQTNKQKTIKTSPGFLLNNAWAITKMYINMELVFEFLIPDTCTFTSQ